MADSVYIGNKTNFVSSKKDNIEEKSDYDLAHKDILMIKSIERHLKLFIFLN